MTEAVCSICNKTYTTDDNYLLRAKLCPACAVLRTIPKLFHDKSFNKLKITKDNKAIIDKIKSFNADTNFVFYGGTGTGKTTLMYAHIMNHNINGFSVYNWIDILDNLKAGFDDKTQSIEIYQKSKYLFIDDLGAEKVSDWGIQQLYKIINYRYENMLTTGITTNLTFSTLVNKYGDRIMSRIKEKYTFVLINNERWR